MYVCVCVRARVHIHTSPRKRALSRDCSVSTVPNTSLHAHTGNLQERGTHATSSALLSMTARVGFPAPWPARVSTRSRRGFRWGLSAYPASVCCRVAISLNECSGATRSSWSPARFPQHKFFKSSEPMSGRSPNADAG
jgi:hypothetical protein